MEAALVLSEEVDVMCGVSCAESRMLEVLLVLREMRLLVQLVWQMRKRVR